MDDLASYIEALRLEVPEQVPDQIQFTSLGSPGSSVVAEEALAEAMPASAAMPKEAEPTDVLDSTKSSDESLVEDTIDTVGTPHTRIVNVDGVSTVVEQNPASFAKRSVEGDERTQLRVRGSKLTSALRTLMTYDKLLSTGPSLSGDEVGRLTRIATMVESILSGSHNDAQNKGAEK